MQFILINFYCPDEDFSDFYRLYLATCLFTRVLEDESSNRD